MSHRRTRGLALLLSLLAGGAAGAAPAAAAPAAASAPSGSAVSAVGDSDTYAVTGTDKQLYAKTSASTVFRKLGGVLIDAPALAVGDAVYFVGVGGDSNVYVRTVGQAWKTLGPRGTKCSGVSAAVVNGVLAVACRGSNGHLYVGKAAATVSTTNTLPRITSFKDLGGAVLYGATVRSPNGHFTYDVVGTNHALYTRTDTAGFTRLTSSVLCYGALGKDESGGGPAFACRGEDGALRVSATTSATGAWSRISGAVVGRPGVALDQDRTTRYYVVGTNSKFYTAGQSSTGAITGFRNSPSGTGQYGFVASSRQG